MAGFWTSSLAQVFSPSVRLVGAEPESALPRWWGSESRRMTPALQCLLSLALLGCHASLPTGQGQGASVAGQGIQESGPVHINTLVRVAVWILENKA